ncbi:hypothetical protein DFH08DRAFT_827845 [Mycena albidolilacea]|uniref:Uncharacterized protein n=1 Tax=Mycena albidolilacea TaxID=1033008 RepID=A0AAD7E7Q8_9AGAR|nr:hypothetical protein DFH08DRAFT_827845 [Mycena albidolilacea]
MPDTSHSAGRIACDGIHKDGHGYTRGYLQAYPYPDPQKPSRIRVGSKTHTGYLRVLDLPYSVVKGKPKETKNILEVTNPRVHGSGLRVEHGSEIVTRTRTRPYPRVAGVGSGIPVVSAEWLVQATFFTTNKIIILVVPAPKETLFHRNMSISAVYMKNYVLSIDLSGSAQCSGLTQVQWPKAAKSGLMFRNHHVVEKSDTFRDILYQGCASHFHFLADAKPAEWLAKPTKWLASHLAGHGRVIPPKHTPPPGTSHLAQAQATWPSQKRHSPFANHLGWVKNAQNAIQLVQNELEAGHLDQAEDSRDITKYAASLHNLIHVALLNPSSLNFSIPKEYEDIVTVSIADTKNWVAEIETRFGKTKRGTRRT